MKNKILIFSILCIAVLNSYAQNSTQKLSYKVYRANDASFGVSSTLVMGSEEAVLIDAQFSKSEAYRVLADIIESGKKLTQIYVSHGDPDYYFGLPIFKTVFPDVVIKASAPTVNHIKETFEKKLDTWSPRLGTNGFDYVIIPKVLKGSQIDLEGEKLIIKGLEGKHPERSYVWIPNLEAIVGGFNLFDDTHLWMADDPTAEDRLTWLHIVEEMKALNPKIIIPSHASKYNDHLKGNAIDFTISYLKTYEKELKKAKNSKNLINAIVKAFPNVESGKGFPLEMGAKVSMKEATW